MGSTSAVYGHHLSGHKGATAWVHSTKHRWNCSGSRRENTSPKESGEGMPLSKVQEGAEPFLLAPAEHLHICPGVRAPDDSTDRNGYDIQQLVPVVIQQHFLD